MCSRPFALWRVESFKAASGVAVMIDAASESHGTAAIAPTTLASSQGLQIDVFQVGFSGIMKR
jgi:hypothetical protein